MTFYLYRVRSGLVLRHNLILKFGDFGAVVKLKFYTASRECRRQEVIPRLSQTKNRLAECSQPIDFFGAPETIRTFDLNIRSVALYPTELRARGSNLAHSKGHVNVIRREQGPLWRPEPLWANVW